MFNTETHHPTSMPLLHGARISFHDMQLLLLEDRPSVALDPDVVTHRADEANDGSAIDGAGDDRYQAIPEEAAEDDEEADDEEEEEDDEDEEEEEDDEDDDEDDEDEDDEEEADDDKDGEARQSASGTRNIGTESDSGVHGAHHLCRYASPGCGRIGVTATMRVPSPGVD